jgi:hypothetical protein
MATESTTGRSWNTGSRFVWHFCFSEKEGIGTSTLLIHVENSRRKKKVLKVNHHLLMSGIYREMD